LTDSSASKVIKPLERNILIAAAACNGDAGMVAKDLSIDEAEVREVFEKFGITPKSPEVAQRPDEENVEDLDQVRRNQVFEYLKANGLSTQLELRGVLKVADRVALRVLAGLESDGLIHQPTPGSRPKKYKLKDAAP
jgi:hypothetical protein